MKQLSNEFQQDSEQIASEVDETKAENISNELCEDNSVQNDYFKTLFRNLKKSFTSVFKNRPAASEYLAITLIAYLFVSIYYMVTVKINAQDLSFVKLINIPEAIISLFAVAAVFFIFRIWYLKKIHIFNLLIAVTYSYALLLIIECKKDIYFTLGVVLIVALFTYAIYKNYDFSSLNFPMKESLSLVIVVIFFVFMSYLVAMATIYRYKTFGASTFDFGIFTQMFEYMKNTGLPLTTCERDKLLSHFAIHFSPIYYLILPGYLIFSCPEYLLAMQAIFICSAVFPIYFLCRHFKFGGLVSTLISIAYLAYPGVVCAAFFDFHENKFITVLILWLIYFLERKKFIPAYIFLALTLSVKEDAALYVIFIGIFYIFARKARKHGLIMIGAAFAYFLIVSFFMTKYGNGVMNDRFSLYFLPGEKTLFDVAKNIVIDPTFFLRNLFSPEKFTFIVYMMAPILFIPFVAKNVKNLFLLAPMIVINLMSGYPYQYDVGYQYTYGTAALLFALFIFNVKEFSHKWRILVCLVAAFSSVAFLQNGTETKLVGFQKGYKAAQVKYEQVEKALSAIPVNVTVTADTYIVPHLYRIKRLYMYPSKVSTDYYVSDIRGQAVNVERDKFIEKEKYIVIYKDEFITIYKK